MASNNKKINYYQADEDVSIVGNIAVIISCLAFVMPAFFKNIHAGYQYILISVGLMLVSILAVFLNARQRRPAVRILPLLAFYDILIYATLFVANIIKVENITTFTSFIRLFHLSYFFEESSAVVICVVTAIAFVTLSLFTFANKYSDSFVSATITIESIVLSLIFAWRNSEKTAYGRVVLSVSVIIALIWMFICTYSNVVSKGEKRGTAFYSLIFSIIILFFNFYFANNATKGLNVFFVIPETIDDSIARKMYPWWLVILLTVLFLAVGTILAVLAYEIEDDVRGYADAKFFYSAAVLALLTKVILSNYFAYSFVLYICLLIVIKADITKDVSRIDKKNKNDRYYDVEDFIFRSVRLLYISICYIFIVQMAENMLYLTLPIALIIMYMLYKLVSNFVRKEILEDETVQSALDGMPKSYHFSIIVLTAVFTASLVYHYRFSLSNFVLLGILVLTVLLVFNALKRKIPNNIKLPEINTVKWLATVFAVIICIVLTASSGAKLKLKSDLDKPSTTISVTVNKKSTINKIEYQWDNGIIFDGYQMLVADLEPIEFDKEVKAIKGKKREAELTLPIQGEKLTVWITDSNGVQTTRTLWFPTWFDKTSN